VCLLIAGLGAARDAHVGAPAPEGSEVGGDKRAVEDPPL
jgi:hypothetical protein